MPPMSALNLVCPACGSSNVKTSRWKSVDAFRVLALRRPVRCHDCYERFYARLFAATASTGNETPGGVVLHIRVRNPNRLLRALLSWLGEPVAEPRIE